MLVSVSKNYPWAPLTQKVFDYFIAIFLERIVIKCKESIPIFFRKYFKKIKGEYTLAGLLETAKKNNILEKCIDLEWITYPGIDKVHYLMKTTNNKYEVFDSERFGKLGLRIYENLDDAFTDKFDRILNSLAYKPSDVLDYH